MLLRLFKSLFYGRNSKVIEKQPSNEATKVMYVRKDGMVKKKVTYIHQNQAWLVRQPHMEKLIRQAFDYPISALEIGTWYGVGSTQIWLDNLKNGSTLMLLDVWKPYSSEVDLQDQEWDYRAMDNLSTDAFLSTFLNIRRFEGEKDRPNIGIQMVRADSELFLPLLADKSFDFIYIDGDHKYEKVKRDIQHAKRLIKSGYGVICGDDLERLPTQALIELAQNFKNQDYVRGQHHFHPGVLLAVAEEFGKVNMANGFWWVICKNGNFIADES